MAVTSSRNRPASSRCPDESGGRGPAWELPGTEVIHTKNPAGSPISTVSTPSRMAILTALSLIFPSSAPRSGQYEPPRAPAPPSPLIHALSDSALDRVRHQGA